MANFKNNQTFDDNLDVDGAINNNQALAVVSGSVSGSVSWNMPFQGTTYKKVIIHCSALNGVAVVTFPVAFQHVPPNIITSDGLDNINVVTTTQTTITGVASTGFIIIEGF